MTIYRHKQGEKTMTKTMQSERDESIAELRETLKPGSKLTTFNTHAAVRAGNCPVCGKALPKTTTLKRENGRNGWELPVCSETCAHSPWHHRDGGYALSQEWM
jgi:DNA repair exonuclease SbcCD ATPase subunit